MISNMYTVSVICDLLILQTIFIQISRSTLTTYVRRYIVICKLIRLDRTLAK